MRSCDEEPGQIADVRALEQLEAIDRSALPAAEQLNYGLFRQDYRDKLESYRFRAFLMPVSQRGHSIQTEDELREEVRFQTQKDY